MPTVTSRSIFMFRRECQANGWHRAESSRWYSTRAKHWPKWTKLNQNCCLPIPCK